MKSFTINSNDSLFQVYEAVKTCRRGELVDDIKKQKYTISMSVGLGHESVLEHTNIIIGITLEDKDINAELIDLLECCHYLHYRMYEDNGKRVLIIAGSIRGYKHIFRNIKNLKNPYLQLIKQELYENTYSDFYKDFIKDNIMDENKFTKFVGKRYPIVKLPDGTAIIAKTDKTRELQFGLYARVLWYDDILEVSNKILEATGIVVPLVDLLEFCTIGFKFQCSRTASHQLVRHRNAVSQESQRYVNYSKKDGTEFTEEDLGQLFVDPIYENVYAKEAKKEFPVPVIRVNHVETPELFSKAHQAILDQALSSINAYNRILNEKSDDASEKIKPEDVRSILPGNMITRLVMTFTYRNLIKAIELRTNPAAQSEIRNIFMGVEKLTKEILPIDMDLNQFICTCKENHYYDNDILPSLQGEIEEDVSEVLDEHLVTEELTKSQVEELKSDLKNEYGEDVSSLIANPTSQAIDIKHTSEEDRDKTFDSKSYDNDTSKRE